MLIYNQSLNSRSIIFSYMTILLGHIQILSVIGKLLSQERFNSRFTDAKTGLKLNIHFYKLVF